MMLADEEISSCTSRTARIEAAIIAAILAVIVASVVVLSGCVWLTL